MRQVYMLGLGFALSLTVGCAPTGFQTAANGVQKTGDDGAVITPQPAAPKACVVDPVDYTLNMQVVNFEMTDRTKATFGMNLSGILNIFGLSLDIKGGRLDMQMALFNSMNPDVGLVDVTEKAKFSDSSFAFNLQAGELAADFGYYHRTPIAKLSNAAIANTFDKLVKNAKQDKVLPTWNARVTQVYAVDGEPYVTVAAGSVAGLLKGDAMTIYNVREHWEDPKKPCASRWNGTEKLLDEPAKGTVVAILADRAVIKLTGASLDQIKNGGVAELSSKDAKKRTLRRSIRIGQIPQAFIKIEKVGELEITKYMLPQIDPVLREKGYYVIDDPSALLVNEL